MILVSDIITFVRNLMGIPSNGGGSRWSDTQLTNFIDRAQKQVISQILFPESRLTLITPNPPFQEYTLPAVHKILRVYLNGQLATRVPGGINTLEGQQVLIEDDSSQGVVPLNGGGPLGSVGAMQPQWDTQTPVTYPYLNNWGAPKPFAQSFFSGQPPRYYLRGGNIGIAGSFPVAGVYMAIDCVRIPSTVNIPTDPIIVPDNFIDAISYRVLDYIAMAENDPAQSQLRLQKSGVEFERQLRMLMSWKRDYTCDQEQLFAQNNRARYSIGGFRVNTGF